MLPELGEDREVAPLVRAAVCAVLVELADQGGLWTAADMRSMAWKIEERAYEHE